jgi:prophage maintenance system killer protein
MSRQLRRLDLYDVLAVVAGVMECDADTAIRSTELDIVDDVLLEADSVDELAGASAVLLSGLVRRRPFSRSNRRLSVAIALQLVAVNGCDLLLEPVEELDELLDRIRSGEASESAVADQLRVRLIGLPSFASFGLEGPSWEEIVMFEKFSEGAKQVIVLAQEQTRLLEHQYIGTEHLLLGLLEEGQGLAAQVLAGSGITSAGVRSFVEETVGRGNDAASGFIPFTPRAKKVLELSHKESMKLKSERIGTEHLLLGLIREGEGLAAQALVEGGADLSKLRRNVKDAIDHRKRGEAAVQGFLTEGSEHSGTAPWPPAGRKLHLITELNNILTENDRLHEEVSRLREKLRHHNIDPDT